jgi:hypothetical protein
MSLCCQRCGSGDLTIPRYPDPVKLFTRIVDFLSPASEIILGMRMAKVQLICKHCRKVHVPCTHCGAIHDESLLRGYGHWLGRKCPSCNHLIPCEWSLPSWIALITTAPIWYLPYKFFLKQRLPSLKAKMDQILKPETYHHQRFFWLAVFLIVIPPCLLCIWILNITLPIFVRFGMESANFLNIPLFLLLTLLILSLILVFYCEHFLMRKAFLRAMRSRFKQKF